MFSIKTIAGDTNISLDTGTLINPFSGVTSSAARIGVGGPISVPHNASVSATAEPAASTYDVELDGNTWKHLKILAMSFYCQVVSTQTGPAAPTGWTPQVYVRLAGAAGSSHDLAISLIPGQVFTWINPSLTANYPNATNDANTSAMDVTNCGTIVPTALTADITGIYAVPDKWTDVVVGGTIEMLP